MKIVKIIGFIFLILILGMVAFGFYTKSSLSPTYAGDASIAGLSAEVEVYFSAYGIPHIYAKNEKDAYRSLGYLHAKERLWQMDLLRHVGSGTLSELFGPDMIENDIFLRTMGLKSYSQQSAKAYAARNHESLSMVQAYLEGINVYINSNPRPLEHQILGLEIAPFTLQNIFEILTYMAFSFSNAHITDPVLTELSQKLDTAYLNDLSIYHYKDESTLRSYDGRFSAQAEKTIAMLARLNVPEFIGSNSWVVGAEKTASGKVLFSNDPHIAFAQPSVWYENHLVAPEGEYYGYHIPGAPFPLLMHSDKHAVGLTMLENDDMDFFVEEIHPEDSNRYRNNGSWKSFDVKEEVIKVKGEEDISIYIRSSVHGPVVSDILTDEGLDEVVTMYWVTTQFENFMMEAIYGFCKAQSIQEIEKAASLIHGPGLNIMYGDAQGNVAWWAVGKLPKRRDEKTSKTFYDGSTGLDDVSAVYPFEKNPHAINPPWGYVHSANNQPDTVDGVIYAGYYLPDDRSERITGLLENDSAVSVEKVKDMLLDDHSVLMQNITGILLQAIKDTKHDALLRALLTWEGNYDENDFRPLVFQKWLHELLKAAQYDEIGADLWPMYKKTHTYKVAAENLVKNETSPWWDNDTTNQVETRSAIIRRAFEKTVSELSNDWGVDYTQWRWGEAHQLNHRHALGEVLGLLNVGPFAVSGGNEVLNNMGYTYTEDPIQTVRFGPSTRRIIDFSDVRNNSWSILPTGQSGNIFSPHYDDQAALYVSGTFRKMIMDHELIKQSENKLVLSPD